ncbi:hypothetical protein [Nonomuraea sp. NPDC049784]|uniref:hypothetical protein n=1 Tax=Nonomuraea sp. NPDC049784 TaxID=3154361 RepID=UPI00340362CF
MGHRYLVGPDGLRVTPVELSPTSEHWLFARMREPNAMPGEVWYRVTKNGSAIGIPGYYQLHELQEIVSLADLREANEEAGEETA